MNCQMKSIYEFLLKSKTTTSTQGMDYIDLGLPSGLLWAKCNIGANEPTEYGDYFMWGSTTPDTDKQCNWEHAPFNDGKSQFNNEYFESIKNKVCPNNILASEYDAATAMLGPNWRMPTFDDFRELINNTSNKWLSHYNGAAVSGQLFTSRINTNELFIPFSGTRCNSTVYNMHAYAELWSSSLHTVNIYASWYIYVERVRRCTMEYNPHCYGCCIRSVS